MKVIHDILTIVVFGTYFKLRHYFMPY